MDRRQPSFRNFIAAFRGHWLEAMSGSFSVPFAIGAVFVSSDAAKIVMLAMAFGGAWWAAYTVWAAERRARNTADSRIAQLESEYPHSLRFAAIDIADQKIYEPSHTQVTGRSLQFIFNLKNAIGRPIEYEFKKIVINSMIAKTGAKEVLSAHSETRFYNQHVAGQFPTPIQENHVVELEYVYGEPGRPSRLARKTIVLTFTPPGGIAWVYSKNEDEQCP
jgi:hypothetical protein